jgi:hypothetical protein
MIVINNKKEKNFMNRKELKELKKLAKVIAEAEYTIQMNEDKEAISKAQADIMKVSVQINAIQNAHEMEDVYAIVDDLVQEILNEKT